MSQPTRAAFVEFLHRLLADHPGPVSVTVTGDDDKPLLVARLPAADTDPEPAAPPVPSVKVRHCRKDILHVLSGAPSRMTAQQILTALSAMNVEWSDRTIQSELAEMLRAGVLTNDQAANPRGYAIAAGDADAP
jgi:hypothetical protein